MTNRLHVPAIINDIIDGREKLTPELEYSIHDLIADMQPDTALLCIATCAQKIANSYILASASMHVMHTEAERMIEDYADLWVQNALDRDVDELSALDALANISEDLECLADLLSLNLSFLKAKDEAAAKVFGILHIQATSHQMIADEFFRAMSLALGEQPYTPMIEDVMPAAIVDAGVQNTDGAARYHAREIHNIIPFPGKHKS